MRKTYLLFGVLSIAALTSCKKEFIADEGIQSATAVGKGAGNGVGGEMMPNELLVKFKAGTSENAKQAALAKISGNVSEKVLTNAMKQKGDNEGFFVVKTPLQALEAISKAKGLT